MNAQLTSGVAPGIAARSTSSPLTKYVARGFQRQSKLESVVSNPTKKKMTLTGWLDYNYNNTYDIHLTYWNFPSEYVGNGTDNYWRRRLYKNVSFIGRMSYVHPASVGDEEDEVEKVGRSRPIGRDQANRKMKAGSSATNAFDVESLGKMIATEYVMDVDSYDLQKRQKVSDLLRIKEKELYEFGNSTFGKLSKR
uniref:DNA helicase n=1 Tax=Tanacetum cinerariifolium TaxID=118510 RepID=A0A699J3Q8_TANCI|nr:DNA helicase [Tanacetum cinerariifolium]